jgi:hypothetical protein
LGQKFPDSGHCTRELFEEVIKGIRILLELPEEDKKEHLGGIKKIKVE